MALLEALSTGVGLLSCKGNVAWAQSTFNIDPANISSLIGTSFDGAFGRIDTARLPWGPALIIGPWNAPVSTVASKIAIALAVGCPVILKPSEWAPRGTDLMGRAIHAAGLPAGVFQMIHGGANIGAMLVNDPRVRCVQFTGSETVGRTVARACVEQLKPCLLELGGSSPMLVLEDADVPTAAAGVLRGLTLLNGQWCCGLNRLLVHTSLLEPLLVEVLARLKTLAVGPSDVAAPAGQPEPLGPLCHAAYAQQLRELVADLQAKGGVAHAPTLLPADPALAGGNFFAPTLVTGVAHAECLAEIFGPVATVHSFASDAEALAMANAAPGFLMGAVYTRDLERGLRLASQFRASICMVNGQEFGLNTGGPEHPAVSFWGTSGFGRDCSQEALVSFFTGSRATGVNGFMPDAKAAAPAMTKNTKVLTAAVQSVSSGADPIKVEYHAAKSAEAKPGPDRAHAASSSGNASTSPANSLPYSGWLHLTAVLAAGLVLGWTAGKHTTRS